MCERLSWCSLLHSFAKEAPLCIHAIQDDRPNPWGKGDPCMARLLRAVSTLCILMRSWSGILGPGTNHACNAKIDSNLLPMENTWLCHLSLDSHLMCMGDLTTHLPLKQGKKLKIHSATLVVALPAEANFAPRKVWHSILSYCHCNKVKCIEMISSHTHTHTHWALPSKLSASKTPLEGLAMARMQDCSSGHSRSEQSGAIPQVSCNLGSQWFALVAWCEVLGIHHLQSTITCNATSNAAEVPVLLAWLSKSQCARGAASSFGMVWLRYTRYPRYTRYTRYTRYSSTRYPRYTGHRITKISSSQWSSTTGMGKGLCWWCSSNFLKTVWAMGFAQLNAGNHITHKTCQQQGRC